MEKMSAEEIKIIVSEFKLSADISNKQEAIVAIKIAILEGGFKTYQMALIIADAISKEILGEGLATTTRMAILGSVGIFLGPIGWIATGVWATLNIASPAYRVTIPSVMQVIYLRQSNLNKNKKGFDKIFNKDN